ncbi:class I SAM-dependent methyltransferase [Streptomyces roseoverticillatus]|uniref:SAM-dependent methyltransferase n=1 Tax=Streptomyces roseoverticillatus TaxID=66429 RepID=UPI001F3EA60B|nr:cyclopropane-fatty-acyl-phospholipid synthase family protein [Streptomyces roseoverticillatus]MCF3105519.1 class I SAM-dependent methyltransferase [Streptomyces roseoverticillatus]
MADAARRLTALAEEVLGAPLPLRIRAWDRSEYGPPGTPVLVIRRRRALRRLLWKPGELGLARAWVAGDIDVEGDLYEALDLLAGSLWERGEGTPRSGLAALLAAVRDPRLRAAGGELVKLAGPGLPPRPPREEARRTSGPLHTLRRDKQSISHHYDVGNAFYERVLGPSMVYSCAYWESPQSTLEEAQRAKLDLVCRKLALEPGQRLLDVGCGWGSMVLHAAREYGVSAVGITLSEEQAAYARKRISEAGLADRVEIRVQDYREISDGPFDAISSIGMAEHVGTARYAEYAADVHALLKPGGRLLNHQIARRPLKDEGAYEVDEFIDCYVFPDGELAPVGRTVAQLEEAGFEVRDVESLREHYALTLRQWVANLQKHWAEAVDLTSAGRARVWRLYMAASALSFERNRIGVNQVLAVRTPGSGASKMPLRTRDWR